MTVPMSVTPTVRQSLLPEDLRATFRRRASRSAKVKLKNLLDLRPYIDEAREEGQRTLMQMYEEAAEDFMCHPDTVRADLATIRRYTPEKLMYWFDNRLSFAHIEAANFYAGKAGKTPLQLLDEAIQLGDENGNTMTVKKLVAFATGGQVYTPAFSPISVLSKLGKFPSLLGWSQEKTARFQTAMDKIREEFFS